MATGDAPSVGSTEQTASQSLPTEGTPDEAGRIPLPPLVAPPPPVVPEAFLNRIHFLDSVLVAILLVFAFLCGSFKATNSDIFLHLAQGRAITGENPGINSFVAAEGWGTQSWLFDLVVYQTYRLGEWSGAALVVLKALAASLIAWLLVRAGSQPGRPIWVAVSLAFLALLTLSIRLLLQPAVVSMLLLAATLTILARATRESRSVWLLPLLCLFWVNVDGWFLLGPITIGLFLVGQLLQTVQQPDEDGLNVKTVGIVFVLSVLACLLNPNHVHAFTALPIGIVQTGEIAIFKEDAIYWSLFLSPFDFKRYLTPHLGLSVTGTSYFVLLGLGLLSFILTFAKNFEGIRWWRVLLWLFGAALSAWTYRAIPFFAVLAGPITALNFLDLAARLSRGEDPFLKAGSRRWAVSGRTFTAVVGCLAIGLSIPGWLQPLPHYRRQVGWGIEVDPGLRDACLLVHSWDKSDGSNPRKWFNSSTDAAYYLAWFAPGEQTYVDARLELFKSVAKEYVTLRRSLTGEDLLAETDRDNYKPAWRKIFAERGIGYVLFHNSDLSRSSLGLAMLNRLYSNPDEFIPCYTGGSAAIFAWREPGSNDPPSESGLAEDYNRLAFGDSPLMAPVEPARKKPLDWWQVLLEGEKPIPASSLSALQYKARFDALTPKYLNDNLQSWLSSQFVSLIGQSAAPSGPLGAGLLLPLRMQVTYLTGGDKSPIDTAARELQQRYLQSFDAGPVASLYLAVRSGRQALREFPDDPVAKLCLAEAYSRLAHRTREQAFSYPHTQWIRQSQIATALETILSATARPEQQRAAHELLTQAYSERQYFELRVKHLREYLRLAKIVGPAQAIPPNELGEYYKQIEASLKEMTQLLKQSRDQYEVQSANKPLLEKVRIALENGLAETALNLLLRADPKDLRDRNNPRESPGTTLLASLLLAMGRVDEVRQLLGVDEQTTESRSFGTHPLRVPAYEWFQVQFGAAIGDYEMADRALNDCIEFVKNSQPYPLLLLELDLVPASFLEKSIDTPSVAALIVGSILLREATQASGLPWQLLRHVPVRFNPPTIPKNPSTVAALQTTTQFFWQGFEQQADLIALRAWLALEAGQLDKARAYAREAIALSEWYGPKGEKFSFQFRSRPLTELVLELAENRIRR